MELETLCIHGGKVDTDKSGAISTPIYQTATYAHPALGQSTGYDYTRDTNPTRDALEAAMAKLEGGSAALAFASGMAAATALMEMFSPGDHIVASDDLYGGSWRLFHRISMKNGLSFDWADTSDPEKTEALIRPETKAIFIETPTNPLMHVTDIRAIARIARRHRILLIVDNTFLSPVFQRPLELGADIVLHSATKYLAGHNDTVAGILVCRTDELAEKLKFIRLTTGAALAPFDSWLVLRGLKTLSVRLKKQEETARQIALWLASCPKIGKVHYPGLPTHKGHGISLGQASGFGAMISFEVTEAAGGEGLVRNILEKVSLIRFAESLGGTETLITYPATQTHAAIPEDERNARGITNRLLRLSVGLESADDLIADLARAMDIAVSRDDPYHFDEIIDRTGTGSLKVDFAEARGKPKDVIPMWVADMDFRCPPAVTAALKKMTEHAIYGYSEPKPGYFSALQNWFSRRHHWDVREEWLVRTPGVVFALCAAIRALTKENDAILIQPPVYYPFAASIRDNRRKLVENQLVLCNGRYTIDLADFERKIIDNKVRLFILCNPHNPVGRIWTKAELTAMADICRAHDVKIVSDEIHADFAFPGHAYTPFGTLGDPYLREAVICTAPSKTFNIAGLQVSNIFIADEEIRRKFRQEIDATGYSQMNTAGLVAAQAAYEEGEEWFNALLTYLTGNLAILRQFTEKRLPGVTLIEPEGTYLPWLDFSGTGMKGKTLDDFIVNEAGLWLDDGEIFGPGGEGFARINIACPAVILKLALERLEAALKNRKNR
ncbi:PatB family C-S lyase [Oxalobacter aliiformigenes]|uniref:PatB family C-S lyase n=1 Tax=Oxalobacter aliiformigenes TaxID=2946593 RepID=UPI0022AFC6CD|nr:PatB family C-S lyase [Oxalobacter aliiformigenes]